MKVVVTGGTGFLGKKLSFRLKEMGFDVFSLGRNDIVGKELLNNGIHFYKGDISNYGEIESVFEDADYVFHCAGLSSPWGRYDSFYRSNVIGTQNVIDASKHNNVTRLIHVSTPSIYFYFDERLDVHESDPLPIKKVNHYAETKFLAEKAVDKAFVEDLPVITIRPRALFGPEDTTILPRLIRMNNKRFIPIIDDGKVLMDLTYVENVVDSLILAMDSGAHTLGKKYNITNGEQVYLIDVLNLLFDKLNEPFYKKYISYNSAFSLASALEFLSKTIFFEKEPILTKYTVSVLSKSQTLNIDAAKKDLNYSPRISINEGLDFFVDWWITNEKC